MRSERGQALLLMLGVLGVVLFGALVLAAWGQSLGAKGGRQRAADLAAVSAAAAMRDAFPRLFEPASSPGHMELWQYLSAARRAARDAGARNGAAVRGRDVTFPGPRGIAPMRVRVVVRDAPNVALGREVPVAAAATAAIEPSAAGGSFPGIASGGGYSGPLAYRQGKGMRPDVAVAFDRLAAAARAEAGLSLIVTSAFRSDAEQARLFAAHPDPRWVARPGESLHRLATELDLGPNAAYGWLAANAGRFGFVRRYSWEPWHFGYSRSPGTASVGFGVKGGDGRATAAVQQFVPARYAPVIAKAAQRWSVSAHLLAAQLYAESGFNPFARSAAGAAGIAQFMPGTARSYGVANPFDPADSIDGQAHLMRELLGRFASVPLALAAYNAGPGAVAACGCIPPYPETQAYVAKILGLLGGGADLTEGSTFSVRLVE